MKAVKIVVVLFLIYAGLVVLVESSLGYFQPSDERSLVISTTDEQGNAHSRVVSRINSEGKLYVAANHWPRAWYTQALQNPNVQVTMDGETDDYLAVPVSGAEHQRLQSQHALGVGTRILTGFPPRNFLRLDAAAPPEQPSTTD